MGTQEARSVISETDVTPFYFSFISSISFIDEATFYGLLVAF